MVFSLTCNLLYPSTLVLGPSFIHSWHLSVPQNTIQFVGKYSATVYFCSLHEGKKYFILSLSAPLKKHLGKEEGQVLTAPIMPHGDLLAYQSHVLIEVTKLLQGNDTFTYLMFQLAIDPFVLILQLYLLLLCLVSTR